MSVEKKNFKNFITYSLLYYILLTSIKSNVSMIIILTKRLSNKSIDLERERER